MEESMKTLKQIFTILTLSIYATAGFTQVDIFKEPFENGVYIVNGDTPVYNLEELERVQTPEFSSQKLMINMLVGNILDLWSDKSTNVLTYCIADTFEDRKSDVVDAFEEASQAWMEHANIEIRYLADQDFNCTEENEMITFDVRPVSVGFYLARAFFPSTPRLQRNVLIDDSSFSYPQSTLVGILKHELGHVLGFRHEHMHEDSSGICANEDKNFKPVTDYDHISVMHYPQCDGGGDILDLKLSESDKIGAEIAYPGLN
jgi:hypothetical protein